MSGALDQAIARVEKLVGLPFQPYTAVRAAIEIDIRLTVATHGKQFFPVDIKTATAGLGQIGARAEKLHGYPLVSCRDMSELDV